MLIQRSIPFVVCVRERGKKYIIYMDKSTDKYEKSWLMKKIDDEETNEREMATKSQNYYVKIVIRIRHSLHIDITK